MNILITGGAGFIGSSLALELLNNGHSVTILDNLSKQIHGEDPFNSFLYLKIKDKCQFIHGDVNREDDWRKALVNQDVVVHLAAETGTGQSMYKINDYIRTNVMGTSYLLNILANETHQVKKVVIASSRAIYGEGKYKNAQGNFVYPTSRSNEDMDKGIFDLLDPLSKEKLEVQATCEESKIHPISVYGITKQSQEDLILSVCGSLGIDAVSLRYQNVYGPGQSLSNPYTGILSIFSNLFLNNQDLNIFEDGLMTRDFVYIDDIVAATQLAIESNAVKNDYFNVGSGESTSVIYIANKLKEIYNSSSKIEITGNYRLGDIRHNFADMSKIESKLGFKPKVNFEQGIEAFTSWVKSQEIVKNDSYQNSLREMSTKGLMK